MIVAKWSAVIYSFRYREYDYSIIFITFCSYYSLPKGVYYSYILLASLIAIFQACLIVLFISTPKALEGSFSRTAIFRENFFSALLNLGL